MAAAPPSDAAGADPGTNRKHPTKPIKCTNRLTPSKRIDARSRICCTQPLQARAGTTYTTVGDGKVGIW